MTLFNFLGIMYLIFPLFIFYELKRGSVLLMNQRGLKASQGKGQGCVSRNMPGEGQGEVGIATIGIEGQPILKVQCVLAQKVPLVLPSEGDSFLFCFFFLYQNWISACPPWTLKVEPHWAFRFHFLPCSLDFILAILLVHFSVTETIQRPQTQHLCITKYFHSLWDLQPFCNCISTWAYRSSQSLQSLPNNLTFQCNYLLLIVFFLLFH